MNTLKKIVLFSMLLGLSISAQAESPRKELQNYFARMNAIQADFTQKLVDSNSKLISSGAGHFAIQRPEFFIWEMNSPSTQKVISNGKTLWVYDVDLKQVTVSPMKKGSSSPAMILSSPPQQWLSMFIISKKNDWYYLRPNAPSAPFKLIMLRFDNDRLKQMQFQDNLGQVSVLFLTKVVINSPLNKAQFQFTPPSDVDVIQKKGK